MTMKSLNVALDTVLGYRPNNSKLEKVVRARFIDLFAGMGGTRLGFENACKELGIECNCIFSSEIKPHAISTYQHNFKNSEVNGDITKIPPSDIPDFDFLLAGFPCQPFSAAGKRNGFLDERSGLFFTILKILKSKKPKGFLLENVEGLVTHNGGRTLNTIIKKLKNMGYKVSWELLDSSDFGVPQNRKRVYIVGHIRKKYIELKNFPVKSSSIEQYLDYEHEFKPTEFAKLLSKKFSVEELKGKAIKDKRGGANNIHSWDLELKGAITKNQKELMGLILRKRRNKKWALLKNIDWMDGMPLTLEEIKTFFKHPNLKKDLDELVEKGYLRFEHPKKKIIVNGATTRVPCKKNPKGYNIVAGKLSFPLVKILNPLECCPTLVATEVGKIGVATKKGVRAITVREGLRFSGFPENYIIENISYQKSFDLIGNTVIPPVIKAVSMRLLGESKNEKS